MSTSYKSYSCPDMVMITMRKSQNLCWSEIIGPNNGNLTINCNESHSCSESIFNGVQSINIYISNDGKDNIHTINITHEISYLFESNNSVIYYNTHPNTSNLVPYYDALITCNMNDFEKEICFIECIGLLSCTIANIIPKSNIIDTLLIKCNVKDSCKSTVLNYTQSLSPNLETLQLLCLTNSACNNMQIYISLDHSDPLSYNTSNVSLAIYCNETLSCQHLSIVNVNNIENTYMSIKIICLKDNSCDSLKINVDKNINIELIAYKYSENIIITTNEYKNINIKCGNKYDNIYLRYDTSNLLNEHELLLRARTEYTSLRLPCEDIEIICKNDKFYDHDQHCEMKYELTDTFNIFDIINSKHNTDCFWIDIGLLYKPICVGNCGTNIAIYKYPISINLKLLLRVDDDDMDDAQKYLNDTIGDTLCTEYFGDFNTTQDTLTDIDVIIGAALNIFTETELIYAISKNPISLLSYNNLSVINCSQYNQNEDLILITSHFELESLSDNNNEINSLFAPNSLFYNEINILFQKYFEHQITIFIYICFFVNVIFLC